MEKETVLILLLLKPRTKTNRLNDIAIMMYHGGCPVLKKYQFLFFCYYFDENHMKDKKIKKEIVLLLKPMTKTSQLNADKFVIESHIFASYFVPIMNDHAELIG